MAKRRSTKADQTAIEGTEPPGQDYNRKIEVRGKKYVDALSQRQEWQAAENNRKVKLDEAMEDEGVAEYWLKDGTQITRDPGSPKIKVKFPTNDEGKRDKPELERVEIEVD